MEMMKREDRSVAVADLQARLHLLGFEIDQSETVGTFGPTTESAVRGFQQDAGLVVDGVVGEATWRRLVEGSWDLGDRLLSIAQPHIRGSDVLKLQTALNALGFTAGKQDGIFGIKTANAVSEFQRNLAISEDRIVGPETVQALHRLRLVTHKGLGARIREREARRAVAVGLAGKRVVIDAGHGGNDLGGIGPSGDTEAKLAFALAARTAALLESHSVETTLTRGPNNNPSDSDRVALANGFNADLLISIHLNSHPLEIASGVATYFFEGDSIASEPGEHLADHIQRALVATGRTDCRTHGKAYPILRETKMPSVVVEPCFITNPEESKLLTDPSTLEVVAQALVGAITSYFSGT
ncbi:MAG: N-acetylmuramoyl-L-alanine amidase [Actinomycetota bacterium]